MREASHGRPSPRGGLIVGPRGYSAITPRGQEALASLSKSGSALGLVGGFDKAGSSIGQQPPEPPAAKQQGVAAWGSLAPLQQAAAGHCQYQQLRYSTAAQTDTRPQQQSAPSAGAPAV